MATEKISKQSAGYVEFQGSNYHCDECYKFEPNQARQSCVEVAGLIKAIGGCNTFVKGPSSQLIRVEIPRKLSLAEAGYVESKVGFSCKRCEHFDRGQWQCEKVAGEIRPFGCCNLWEKSPVFGEIV